jgi:mono/diheme cytochrome c family protein
MNTRQFNLTNIINGFSGNQIDLLKGGQYFSNTPEPPNVLPRHLSPSDTSSTIEARVRSYLAVNCAYCHQPSGTASPSAWDGRHEITLDQTGLINGEATNNGGSSLNKLVVSGDLVRSILYNRVAAVNGFTRMPPLATSELDQQDIALLAEWITQSLPARQTYSQWRQEKFGSISSPAGEPMTDADGDGRSNEAEFLAATEPLSSNSFLAPTSSRTSGQFQLDFTVPVNRSVQVETSSNLVNWTLWNVPGNQGTPQLGGAVSLQGPATDPHQFYRLKLRGN